VLYNECDRVSLRRADRVVTLARAFVDHLTRRGVQAERVMVLHNAIDARPRRRIDEERQRLRALWGIDAGEPVVLCVGRLSREKGHRDLIAALARLKTRHRVAPFRLVVAGDGPERNALQSLAQRAGIADAIRWLGYIENAERLYGGADAAVLPSHSEGSPVALLEAAAYGLPIVATAVGGVPEILEDGESGLLVPPRDPDALAAALYVIVADRTTAARLGRNAHAAVAARHDPMTRTCTLIQMYRQLAAAPESCAVHGTRACTC
jgi:glycosyltransferase involved in cell wall biosynthesis